MCDPVFDCSVSWRRGERFMHPIDTSAQLLMASNLSVSPRLLRACNMKATIDIRAGEHRTKCRRVA